MNADDRELTSRIRRAVPPMGERSHPADLWPRLARRLEGARTRPGRLDWALVGLVVVLLAAFPEIVLLVLYHL